MIRLHDLEVSGNCYKVRLFLSLLGIAYEKVPVKTRRGEQKRAEFLALNPRGQVPVLEDDGFVAWDSASILGHRPFARAFDHALRRGGQPRRLPGARPALPALPRRLYGQTHVARARAPDGGVSLDEYASLQKATPENIAVASGPTGPGLKK